MKPLFQHDRDCCTFLGTYHECTPEGQQISDLYACEPKGATAAEEIYKGNVNLIARHSSEPSDYVCTPLKYVSLFTETAISVAMKMYLRRLQVYSYGIQKASKVLNPSASGKMHVFTNRSDIIVMEFPVELDPI